MNLSVYLFISPENSELQMAEESQHWAPTAVGGGLGSASSTGFPEKLNERLKILVIYFSKVSHILGL